MKRSDAHFEIRDDLYKIEHMFKGYQKGNLALQTLLDAVVNRVLNKTDTIGMLPPSWTPIADSTEIGYGGMFNIENGNYPKGHYNVDKGKSIYCGSINSWEPEDD